MLKTERQRKLLEILSIRRYETMENLAHELGASMATIKRDLIELTDQASFYTKCGKYGGGVYAVDGWYYSRSYLTNDQEKALREVLSGLQPGTEQNRQLQSILDSTNYNECCGCAACLDICPKTAITMSIIHNGFKYPKIDINKCINCGLCRKVCAFESVKKDYAPVCYFGWNLDSDTRIQSTSGGAFTAISKAFFRQQGIQKTHIYGAGWETSSKVKHLAVDSIEDIAKLRRSKYIQSETSNVFRGILNDLKNGLNVMFTGTPCQVASLKNFIPEKLQSNLLTVDIICNGVASPIVFSDYIEALEIENGSSVERYSFRNKHTKEKSQKFVHIIFSDGKKL